MCLHLPPIDTSLESGEDLCEVCGSNAECREVDGRPVCTCLPGFLGAPPNCHPECVVNRDCSSAHACNRQNCVDPCIGVCGTNADCRVINHSPVCTCLPGYTGEPFVRCNRIPVGKKKNNEFPSPFQPAILHTGVEHLTIVYNCIDIHLFYLQSCLLQHLLLRNVLILAVRELVVLMLTAVCRELVASVPALKATLVTHMFNVALSVSSTPSVHSTWLATTNGVLIHVQVLVELMPSVRWLTTIPCALALAV